ncbi:GNAT family N-acetyltransferase [Tenacibaculum sp. MEBiC06402]|uniref:GNAT family N-acetyltransferase n=1 Tax=unclassified Tenacibaculum TaxID=2635139 RepID=UPI003B9D2F01
MNIHIETERLIIRDLEEFDVDGMFALDSDPDVHKFLGNRPISTKQEAEEVIANIRQQYIDNGIGRWAIVDKKSNDFVGWTGLKYETGLRKEFNYYDLGYRLRKEYWGKGIATETAVASLKYGFEKMNLKEIGAAADIDHIVSNKILQRIGLQLVETFEYDNTLNNWYNLTKEEWLKNNEL